MKTCRECEIKKPMTEYYEHKGMTDGHLNKCKSCVRSRVLSNTKENADYYKKYDKQRDMLPHRVQARKAYAQTDQGKLAAKKARQKYVETYPIRRAAHIIFNNALRDGKVEKLPCLICGGESQAHHPDYSRPLDVVWLCVKHHKQAHQIF